MSIRIVQWNIRFDTPVKEVVKVLQRLRPDACCLQEVTYNTPPNEGIYVCDEIGKQLKLDAYFVPTEQTNRDSKPAGSGIAILSKWPCSNPLRVIVKPGHDLSNRFDPNERVYAEVCMKVGDKNLTIGAIHSSYTNRFLNDEIKKPEVQRLMEMVSYYKERYVLCGDLNSLPDSYTVTAIEKHLKNLGPSYDEKTWPSVPQNLPGWKPNLLAYRLDYIFGTREIISVKSEIVETECSDHYAIVCDITWAH